MRTLVLPGLARADIPLSTLAAAGFLSVTGARILDPLLAVVARDFHATIGAVSGLVAAFTLAYGVNQIVLGPASDRHGKLRVILAALTGCGIANIACALAPGLASLTALRAFAGACSGGLVPVAMAYIGDFVPYAERQITLGRFMTGIVLAQMLAGPLGGVFGQYLGWRGVFLFLAAIALGLALLLLLRLPDLPDRRDPEASLDPRRYQALLRTAPARRLLLGTLAEGALIPGAFPFIAPWLHEMGGLSYAGAGLVLAWFGVGAFLYTRWVRPMLARLGEGGLVLGGGVVMVAALLASTACGRWEPFILVELSLGLGYLMMHGVLQARATELLPDARATATSGFVFMLFLGQALGAVVMGQLIGRFGYCHAFLFDAAGIALLVLWLWQGLGTRPGAAAA